MRSLEDKFEVSLRITGTFYTYGQEAAESAVALGLAKLVCSLGLQYSNAKVKISVRKK